MIQWGQIKELLGDDDNKIKEYIDNVVKLSFSITEIFLVEILKKKRLSKMNDYKKKWRLDTKGMKSWFKNWCTYIEKLNKLILRQDYNKLLIV